MDGNDYLVNRIKWLKGEKVRLQKELKKIGLENYEISKKYLSSNVKEDWKKILK